MARKRARLPLLGIVFCLLFATFASADNVAITFVTNANPAGNDGEPNNTLGWQFTLSTSINISALGFYDDFGNGFTSSHDVAIYSCTDSSCTADSVVVSGTVAQAAPLGADNFRYTPLGSSVLLGPGYYVIGGLNNGENYAFRSSITAGPGITYVQDRYNIGPSLVFPTLTFAGSEQAYFGPNFQYTTVPEPSALLLLGTGIATLAGVIRRKR